MLVESDLATGGAEANPCVRIFGQDRDVQVGTSYRPHRLRILYPDGNQPTKEVKVNFRGATHGMSWEAVEAARCLLAGKLGSEVMPWEESLSILRTLDKI